MREWTRFLTGLAVPEDTHEEEKTVCYPNVRQFLEHVKKTGANHAGSSPVRVQKKLFALMYEHYRSQFGGIRGIPATYHVAFGTCQPK